MTESNRPTVLYWPPEIQLSRQHPLVFDDSPGLLLLRANQFGIDTFLNPDDRQIDRLAATATGPVYACFSPDRVGTAIRQCRRLRQQGLEVTAVNGVFVPREGIDAFSSLWLGNSLAQLWQHEGFSPDAFQSFPDVSCSALGRDGGRARLQVLFSEIPDASLLSFENIFSITPLKASRKDSIGYSPRRGSSPTLACFCGGDPDDFVSKILNETSVRAVAACARDELSLGQLQAGVAVYTWFEPDDLMRSESIARVENGVAYVPIGHPDADVPESISHILRLRDCGYTAIVPRYWRPEPGSGDWNHLAGEYGFRNPSSISFDDSEIVFKLPALDDIEGPELISEIQRENVWPPLETDKQLRGGVSLGNVHRVIKLYSASIESNSHAADLIQLAVEALPQQLSSHSIQSTKEYPFVMLNGEDPLVLLNALMSDRLTSINELALPVYAPIQHVVRSGGKRIRGILSLVLWAASGLPAQAAGKVAVALEWFHAASLIQDDLPSMDNEQVRRGEATAHRRHGEAAALLASDALVMLAFEELTELEPLIGASETVKIIATTTRAIGREGLVGGQSHDLELGNRVLVSTDDLLKVHQRKTAPLFRLIASCCGIAAAYDDRQLRQLETALTGLGIAFQIVDDLIDEEGGKNRISHSDQRNHKPSFATVMSHESALRLAENYLQPLRDVLASNHALGPLANLLDFVTERRH